MLRNFLGTLSVAALTAMPAMADQHSAEADDAMNAEAQTTQSAEAQEGDQATGALEDEGFVTAARASVMDREGNQVGTVTINETLSGTPLVIVALNGIPSGAHGIHLHETGDCSAEDFTSAGGHIAGDAEHGVFAQNGPHPGDLPNGIVGEEGGLNVEYFQPDLDIQGHIFDEDGAAFVVHSGADDYMSQPAGDSGDRIACGVLEDA
ncbi:superoxide dismutase, Cu-Zn family [Palleronia marisminoris]|uniref:Superoxide dismutase-like protein YojM n=1 Tax=Palleronia marisminoris TaxID=315423 RepID=A0A1Y5TIA2_9RHOB|nr:superoxide dismutase family protein [Palleronia marisminoris]SFH39579.1 superoxide dismutase, Cu-Zn family [Palleronia marisminoris]SLN64576.1 Superoxide dismutase-like protein YojM precursor [Palleronia marisminoris]